MTRLYVRLALALITIMALVGAGFLLINSYATRGYYEELTQRLNAPIAMYVTGERQLIDDGVVDDAALKQLAQQAMVINPSVEVYLLDRSGKIIGHSLAPESVLRERVDTQPLRELIAGEARLPFKADDPRSLSGLKIFSAAEVRDGQTLQGFLYVVLGGQQYDALASSIRGSYIRQQSILALLLLLAGGLAVGLVVFGALTRPLTRLKHKVNRLHAESAESSSTVNTLGRGDELAALDNAFVAMTARIQTQMQQLTENDKLRRELISNVSHDLRTPLASMQGYIETLLLKDGELTADERIEYLHIARKHTQRLNQLVGDLFELSKLDAATAEPSYEDFSLAELLQDTALEFELEAADKGVEIKLDVGEFASKVNADIGLIQRVLENLLRNALFHTPAGGLIRVKLEMLRDSVNISVDDTGCGIPQDELACIFDRFYRHESGQRKAPDSSGLGLAIVKRILDLHGSRISVASEIDHGTRFAFDLPVARRAA